ncbi:MAG TPA: hypothetical protein VHM91_13665 [Verrucomicrobiales bacterium]|jgi:hypothetical protein|nr:hypothetical protein [Verrucomicrobiales bacterium]
MSPFLHILAEGERDELFYERICEKLTGLTFQRNTSGNEEYRYVPGANWKTVFRLARLALSKYSHLETSQEIAILIAMDNDRAPGHPGGREYPRPLPGHDRKKEPRYPQLQSMVAEKLGTDPAERKVQAVIAMPVEMIESWLLLLLDPARREESLPPFSETNSAIAREYYGKEPPPQLKDESEASRKRLKLDPDSHFFAAADTGDLEALTAASPSFAVFRKEVEVLRELWNPGT